MSSKLDDERKKLPTGSIVYKLEIAINPKTSTVEYIVEGYDEIGATEQGPIDSNWDYLEDYFDEEDFKLLESMYEVGES